MKLWHYGKITLVLSLVFCAGAVSGSLVTAHVIKKALENSLKFDHWTTGAMDVLQSKLNLKPAQRERVQVIIDQMGREIKGAFSQAIDQTGQSLVRSQRLVDQELDPGQRVVHAEMKRQFRADLKTKLNIDLPPE